MRVVDVSARDANGPVKLIDRMSANGYPFAASRNADVKLVPFFEISLTGSGIHLEAVVAR